MQRANRHPKDSVQRQEGLALASQRLDNLVQSLGDENAKELINVQLAQAECFHHQGYNERAVPILESMLEAMEGRGERSGPFTCDGRVVGNLTYW